MDDALLGADGAVADRAGREEEGWPRARGLALVWSTDLLPVLFAALADQ